jgi:hypothetical protein
VSKLSIGDRLVSGVLGLLFGAMIGFVLSWLFGVYSNTMGPSRMAVDMWQWVKTSAIVFCVLGLVTGPDAGTTIGNVIAAIFEFENTRAREFPVWLAAVLLIGVVFVMGWLAT